MLVWNRAVISYIRSDGKQPAVDRFTSTVLAVFPQPYDLMVEIFFDLSIPQEYFQVLDIEPVIHARCGNRSVGGGMYIRSIVSQIIQQVNPVIVSACCSIGPQFSTDIDAIHP